MKHIYTFILLLSTTIPTLKSQCADYTHYSGIDCNYEVILIGFLCDTFIKPYTPSWSPLTGHSHSVSNANITCPFTCGCWENHGTLIHPFNCGFCWDPDDDLCTNSSFSGDRYRLLGININSTNHMLMDWRDRDFFEILTGYKYETTVCCPGNGPDDCTPCACGVAEVNWEAGETWLRPAHDPYYPPCEEP
jgi:hypothetical protein